MDATHKITKNLGGNRLGSGNKNDISMHAYNRSTHDMSRAWRSSMNAGTLVPFLVEPALPGDTFTIDLEALVRTMPALGPLYGSYKLQMDVFECPIRLYNGLLHNNMTKIGLNMAQVKMPKVSIKTKVKNPYKRNFDIETSQISKTALLNYLGLNGFGDVYWAHNGLGNAETVERKFNAVPILAYYDIYKNYYANKQEERGIVITAKENLGNVTEIKKIGGVGTPQEQQPDNFKSAIDSTVPAGITLLGNTYQELTTEVGLWTEVEYYLYAPGDFNVENCEMVFKDTSTTPATYRAIPLAQAFPNYTLGQGTLTVNLGKIDPAYSWNMTQWQTYLVGVGYQSSYYNSSSIELKPFDLQNIDDARIAILQNTGLNNQFTINTLDYPYKAIYENTADGETYNRYSQNGLCLKTYQSDMFNNWLQTEWIDGTNGINQITAIDVSSGSFTIDALNLANKVYNMLNRIAVSGGSYEDYIEAVYSTTALRRAETPVYKGGMSAEIVFEEVVSQSATTDEPLGTLAGKGSTAAKRGGHIEIRSEEPSFIIGIVSITPRLDYSQGNKWFMTELDTLDDLHKPALDGIGFQDLMAEQLAWYGAFYDTTTNEWVKPAIGKIPAWMNYMTAVNETHGDFAEQNKCMFMTLNRQYEYHWNKNMRRGGIKDVTTYINPEKYNYIFADTTLASQNFWVQIGMKIEARRVMSAKVIPYL